LHGWALSDFLPGGGAEMDAGTLGKIYVVPDGEVTIRWAVGGRRIACKSYSCTSSKQVRPEQFSKEGTAFLVVADYCSS